MGPSTSSSSSPNPAQEHVAAGRFLLFTASINCINTACNLRPRSGYKITTLPRSFPPKHPHPVAPRLCVFELTPPLHRRTPTVNSSEHTSPLAFLTCQNDLRNRAHCLTPLVHSRAIQSLASVNTRTPPTTTTTPASSPRKLRPPPSLSLMLTC